jgi:hypothetical protein
VRRVWRRLGRRVRFALLYNLKWLIRLGFLEHFELRLVRLLELRYVFDAGLDGLRHVDLDHPRYGLILNWSVVRATAPHGIRRMARSLRRAVAARYGFGTPARTPGLAARAARAA